MPAAEGQPDRTLRELRKLAKPEAKSAIFNQLFRTQGAQQALDWIATSGIGITDLDAGGALNVLLQKVETDDFDGALKDSEALTAEQLDAIPALRSVRCSLLLASALPKDLKRLPFQGMPINPRELRFASTPQAAAVISKARADLDRALGVLDALRIVEIRPFLEEMALWLRLEDKGTHDAAVAQVAEEIKDPAKTLRRVRLALSYSIPFNRDALTRSLVAEKKIGNWTAGEQFAAFLLAFYSEDLGKTAEFFDNYGSELYSQENLAKGILLGIEIEVLSRVGRFEDARERLARHRGKWVHQPSLVAKAKRIKQLLADGRLKVLRGAKTNAEKAVLKIDPDLQFLLDKARENKAVVIRSAPVHKLGSLLEEVADLSSYREKPAGVIRGGRVHLLPSEPDKADTYVLIGVGSRRRSAR